MSTLTDKLDRSPSPNPLLPATRVRIQDAVRVGQAGPPANSHHSADCPNAAVQVRTIQENGEIRFIEVRCSCGQVIRLRCEYDSGSR
jgi:hypothetical protein